MLSVKLLEAALLVAIWLTKNSKTCLHVAATSRQASSELACSPSESDECNTARGFIPSGRRIGGSKSFTSFIFSCATIVFWVSSRAFWYVANSAPDSRVAISSSSSSIVSSTILR